MCLCSSTSAWCRRRQRCRTARAGSIQVSCSPVSHWRGDSSATLSLRRCTGRLAIQASSRVLPVRQTARSLYKREGGGGLLCAASCCSCLAQRAPARLTGSLLWLLLGLHSMQLLAQQGEAPSSWWSVWSLVSRIPDLKCLQEGQSMFTRTAKRLDNGRACDAQRLACSA